ncbi:MAG: pantetheine-phosphate adenylyltransferase [Planctomycetota bacterium]|nr:pantetheine-phosphate adenylyltransferase [Planctomycetota bacterium]
MTTALFPGTFDPVTYGHLDVVRRASRIFDQVLIGVAHNPHKKPIFDIAERLELINELLEGFENVKVTSFEGVTVQFMAENDINVLIRGIRTFSDFEYEAAMANANRRLDPRIETVFIMSGTEYSFVSSHMIKELVSFGGNVEAFVPRVVARKLREKFLENNGLEPEK